MVNNMNDGKRWEQNFKDSLGLSCIRLYDTTNGFSGVRNPCDFIYYRYPYQYLFELKSTQYDHIYLNKETTKRQIDALVELGKIDGILGGLCVEFREQQKAYFIPAVVCREFLEIRCKKSISIRDCEEHELIREIPLEYKITNCTINKVEFDSVMSSLMYHMRWGGRECAYR